jgi:hypothetical protein
MNVQEAQARVNEMRAEAQRASQNYITVTSEAQAQAETASTNYDRAVRDLQEAIAIESGKNDGEQGLRLDINDPASVRAAATAVFAKLLDRLTP